MTTDTEDLTLTVGAIPAVDPGTYAATLIKLEKFTYGEGDETKTLLRWAFALDDETDDNGETVIVDGVSSLAMGPKSKAYGWLAGLLGRTPETGEVLTPKLLLGRGCMVTVVLNDDGYSKISAVVPAPKKRAAPVEPAAFVNPPAAAEAPAKEAATADLPF